MSMFPLADAVGWKRREAMSRAMMTAMKQGRYGEQPDFTTIEYAAAWEWLHWFRGAGKTSAYGPMQQAANDDANSHALRGFIVGWAMCNAYHEAAP